MLRGQRWWWYAVALGLFIAGLAADLKSVREVVLPLTWVWPMLLWSAMGVRELAQPDPRVDLLIGAIPGRASYQQYGWPAWRWRR